MPRVAVLGGTGFLGARVLAALRRAGLDAVAASRRGEVKVDVTKPETFDALAPFDLVVDLSDTVSTPPDALLGACLERGQTVIECTSEAACVERLHRAHAATKGRLILGGGIFTGVSNLLAREVARRAGDVKRVTLGVSSSPFSGAGKGTIELMLRAMETPAVRYADGARVEEPTIREGPRLDFGSVVRRTGFMSLAEPFMVHTSTGAKTVDVLFAARPGFLVSSFALIPAWLARARWFQALLRGYFTVLRRVLLASTASRVELMADADGARGVVVADDGMDAAAWALAAMVEAVLAAPKTPGACFIDDVCTLGSVISRANQLANREVLTQPV